MIWRLPAGEIQKREEHTGGSFAILLCAGPARGDSKELYLDGSDIGGEKRRWPSILEQCANSLA